MDTTTDELEPPPPRPAMQLSEVDNRTTTVERFKDECRRRGLDVPTKKADLQQVLRAAIAADPDWAPSNARGQWTALTPIAVRDDSDRQWSYEEQFDRPTTAAPQHGTVRRQHLRICFYDTKPVLFLSTDAETIRWCGCTTNRMRSSCGRRSTRCSATRAESRCV